MLLSVLLYTGVLLVAVSPARPVLAVAGAALVGVALLWPASTRRATGTTRLDALVPEWQFDERHETRVNASAERVWEAIHEVTASEIRLFRTLTTIRRFGRSGPESILNAPPDEPILRVAARTGFQVLAEDPPRELVAGLRLGAGTLAALAFRVEPRDSGGVALVTETRVAARTSRARRRFALYWRAILPGSDLIRRTWLRAIRVRAERGRSGA
jgi:hypothetical protein